MRKLYVLLGLAILLAAVAVLLVTVSRSGAAPEAAEPAVLRPSAAREQPRGDLLAASDAVPAARAGSAERVEAKQKPRVKLGAETARALGAGGEGATLSGRVVGLFGIGVADAQVEIEAIGAGSDGLLQILGGTTKQEVVTGQGGEFRSPLFERWEEVRVEVEARGYRPYADDHPLLDREGDQDLGVIELEPAVVLGGRVVDADGAPVEGAEVRRISDGQREWAGFGRPADATTDAEGRFELPHEPPGDYTLEVEAEGLPSGRLTGTTPPGGGEDLTLVVRLPREATIAGSIDGFPPGREYVKIGAKLADGATATGLEDAFADLGFGDGGHTGDVAADGTFVIRGLEAGRSYRVRAFTREGFGDQSWRTDGRTARAGEEALRLSWKPGARLSFRVLDARTSNPIDDLEVRYRIEGKDGGWPASTKKRSFSDGEVDLVELYPGPGETLALQVSAPGYLDLRREGVAVPADGEVDLGTLLLDPAPTLRVRVVDAAGEPVRNARVRLDPESEDEEDEPTGWFSLQLRSSSGRTDDAGLCALAAPATATARLSVSHPRYASLARAGVAMPAGGEREETVQLGLGGEVTIGVLDDDGLPVRGITVEHRYPPELEADEADHETNRRGEVKLTNQPAGEHAFRVMPRDVGPNAPDGEETWTPLLVQDEAQVDLVLRVSSRGTVAGRITEGGKPLARARVALSRPGEAGSERQQIEMRVSVGARFDLDMAGGTDETDREGRYEIEDVPAGRYRLRVSHEDRAAEHVVPVEVRAGSNRLDVDLPLTAIEGRVLDSSGAPVHDARVVLVPAPEEGAKDEDEIEIGRQALRALYDDGRGVHTDADGRYRLVGVIEDVPVMVEAAADGYVAARSRPVTVALGRVVSAVDVRIERGATLRVRLEGAGGFSFAQATWEGDGKDAPAPQVAMFRDGEAVITGLKAGPWRVRRLNDDEEKKGVLVQVPKSGEVSVDLVP